MGETETWAYADLAAMQSPAIASALAYWRQQAVAASIPSRAQMDPMEMRHFLSKILIIDILGRENFIYRLCGTEIAYANGKDLTGQQASEENLGKSYRQFVHSYHRAIDERQPIAFSARFWWQDRAFVTFEQLNLPLSTDGITVDKLLCVVAFNLPE